MNTQEETQEEKIDACDYLVKLITSEINLNAESILLEGIPFFENYEILNTLFSRLDKGFHYMAIIFLIRNYINYNESFMKNLLLNNPTYQQFSHLSSGQVEKFLDRDFNLAYDLDFINARNYNYGNCPAIRIRKKLSLNNCRMNFYKLREIKNGSFVDSTINFYKTFEKANSLSFSSCSINGINPKEVSILNAINLSTSDPKIFSDLQGVKNVYIEGSSDRVNFGIKSMKGTLEVKNGCPFMDDLEQVDGDIILSGTNILLPSLRSARSITTTSKEHENLLVANNPNISHLVKTADW